MTVELKMLLWTVALTVVQMLVATSGTALQIDQATLVGNREEVPRIAGWAGRARRAHLNMLENVGLFIALVLIVTLAKRTNSTTALGAELFFWGRLVYAAVYVAGIPYLRTLIWFVSMAGLVMMFVQCL